MIFGPLATLQAEAVCYLVYHTTATPNGEDTSAEAVHRYHRSKGWASIGYHFLVRFDGSVELGRPVTAVGAHVAGLNACSLSIAFSGHGDLYPLTPAQLKAGVQLGARLMVEYGIPVENVIGHREVNGLIEEGVIASRYRTPKSCPGVKVSMHKIRRLLDERLNPPPNITSQVAPPPSAPPLAA